MSNDGKNRFYKTLNLRKEDKQALKFYTKLKKDIDLEKYTKEDVMYHSSMICQVITTGMIFTLQETLRYLGSESTNLSSEAIKSVFVFL